MHQSNYLRSALRARRTADEISALGHQHPHTDHQPWPCPVADGLVDQLFTFVRIQDLRQELNHTGQLIANQLATAVEPGVTTGDIEGLKALMRATLSMPSVRYVEIQDSSNTSVIYIDQPRENEQQTRQMEVFLAPFNRSAPPFTAIPASPAQEKANPHRALHRVIWDGFWSACPAKHSVGVSRRYCSRPASRRWAL